MNKVIIFLAGVATGAVGTYFLVKNKLEQQANEEIAAVREYYMNLEGDENENEKDMVEIEESFHSVVTPAIVKVDPAERDAMLKRIREKPDILDYTKYSNEQDLAESEHPEDDDLPESAEELEEMDEGERLVAMSEEINKQAKLKEPPRLIKYEDYLLDKAGFDKQALYFYQGDDTLVTEDEEIVDNIEYLVGDCLVKYGFVTNDEQVIYVRNTHTATDYEITKVPSAYSDVG